MRQQAKLLRKVKHTGTQQKGKAKKYPLTQLEEINHNTLVK